MEMNNKTCIYYIEHEREVQAIIMHQPIKVSHAAGNESELEHNRVAMLVCSYQVKYRECIID